MTSQKAPYYITTAIAYANGNPHLGHAYEAIITDVMARFKRLDGHDTYFLTGMDEHGIKVWQTARDKGISPQELCKGITEKFVEQTKTFNISNDQFIRTTEPRHHEASQALWQKLEDNGDIYLDKYAGWYSVRDEAYYDEKELTLDQATGKKLSPQGTEVEWVEEESYFFKLSAYEEKLLKLYEENPDFIAPQSRKNEVTSFVKGGLLDLSISRTTFDWGVKAPKDPKHVMYVWLDALTNYITAIGYPDTQAEEFQKFWPANAHVVGKDIIRFHCIYWPAFLMAANLPLPKQVFAHGFINVDGQKMSKSLGNVIAPTDLLERYGVDQTRYLLMRTISHGDDGNYNHEQATVRINADLSNALGNLVQRTLSMIFKNCEGVIPQRENLTQQDKDLLNHAYTILGTVRPMADKFQFNRVLEEIWKLVSAANIYVDEQAPWGLKKTDPERMGVVLSVIAETIRCLGILVLPVMPESGEKILEQLKVSKDHRQFDCLNEQHALGTDISIEKPEGIFPRIVEEEKAA
ncbi:MAG: methionine--tRNA ligase [Bdellovibrionales bacterium]